MPDLDRVIALSDYFDVTTDYLLKGIQPSAPQAGRQAPNASVFAIAGTAFNVIGLAAACGIWYEQQTATAILIGLILMAMGCMIFGIGIVCSAEATRPAANHLFWKVNIWVLAFLPLAVVYNLLTYGIPAPYPLLFRPIFLFFLFWLVYFAICLLARRQLLRSDRTNDE